MVLTYRAFAAEVLGPVAQLPVLDVPLTNTLGCVVAQTVRAVRPVPGFRQSASNGFAVLASDVASASEQTPVTLPICGQVAAGDPASSLEAGHCARIAAGAPVPEGADAVAGMDQARVEQDKVIFSEPVTAGAGVRQIGSEFQAGQEVVVEGEVLGHVAIGQLALAGHPRVPVHPRPRVVVVTIGSELVRVGEAAGESSVNDAAGVLLSTTAQRLGADCYRVGPVPDVEREVRNTLEDQLVRADILVTVGGIDDADDILRASLARDSGAEVVARFDGPALRPCGAYGVGRIGPDRTPMIMLPSDPAKALLAFHALVGPVIAAMLGAVPAPRGTRIPAPIRVELGTELVPGWFSGERFVPVPGVGLADLARATGMAVCNAGSLSAEVIEWPR